MRLFSFHDDGGLGGSYWAFGGGTMSYPKGISVGRLNDDGTVEVAEGRRFHAGQLRPAPAVPRPEKIVCIGFNYREHVTEGGREIPDHPLLFAKFANAVVADGEPIVRPAGSHALDLEAELGVVIGR